jgi:hypothetical protein
LVGRDRIRRVSRIHGRKVDRMNDDDREVQQYLEEQEQQYLELNGESENENQ